MPDNVIITGGSIMVEFDPPFDNDDEPGKKGKKHSCPDKKMKIAKVVVEDLAGNVLNEYALPTKFDGKCKVKIKS